MIYPHSKTASFPRRRESSEKYGPRSGPNPVVLLRRKPLNQLDSRLRGNDGLED
jgi:hypothetical protein